MTFEKDGIYRDANGDSWRVLAKNTIKDGTTLLIVAQYIIPGPNRFAQAIVEDDGKTATVLLDEGFTTLYDWDDGSVDIRISICNGRMPTKAECEEIRRLMDTLGIACGQDNVDIEVDGKQEWELEE